MSDIFTKELFLFLSIAFFIAAIIWIIVCIFLLDNSDEDSEKSELNYHESFKTHTKKEAEDKFKGEISAGLVKNDPIYGMVYLKKPDDVDDLKKISGIATTLENKLNTIGIYKFKQVATWTDECCKEFSKMLSFKNRVYKDNWIKQASDLHQEKYKENIK